MNSPWYETRDTSVDILRRGEEKDGGGAGLWDQAARNDSGYRRAVPNSEQISVGIMLGMWGGW